MSRLSFFSKIIGANVKKENKVISCEQNSTTHSSLLAAWISLLLFPHLSHRFYKIWKHMLFFLLRWSSTWWPTYSETEGNFDLQLHLLTGQYRPLIHVRTCTYLKPLLLIQKFSVYFNLNGSIKVVKGKRGSCDHLLLDMVQNVVT